MDLLPYNEGGLCKLARLVRTPAPLDVERPSPEHVAAIAARLAEFDLTVRTGG